MIEKRGHALVVSLPKEPVPLFVDPMRMSQVLSNLLVNAAKYTDEGGHIELRARVEGAQCVIDIADDGKGLDEATLQSMFEMFWRGGELDVTGTSSMGIGLALVRTVVGLHEGTITAKSDGPGHGSIFTVMIPVAAREATTDEAAAGVQAPAASARPGLRAAKRARKIVIADDVEDVAWSLSAVLELQGTRCGP
jgi:two-component system CheB/CheR fusion protein